MCSTGTGKELPSEHEEQCAFVSAFRKAYPSVRIIAIPNGGWRDIRTAARLKAEGDQYAALLMQSIGDRLAEATSEMLHARVRRELWGYAPDENLTIKQMYQAAYRGIRPAVGYPSLPDQRAIFPLAQLLDFAAAGITLPENGAMYPQSSVCGLYLASPHAHYFIV